MGDVMKDWFLIFWLCAFIIYSLSFFSRFPRPSHSRNCFRILAWVLLRPLDEILSVSRLDRQTLLRCSISLSGHLDHRYNHHSWLTDLLAAFACGTSSAWDGFFNKQTEESVFSSIVDTLFNVSAFVFVGT